MYFYLVWKSGHVIPTIKTSSSRLVKDRGGGAVGKSVGPASGRLGVQFEAATGLSRKNR